MSLLHPRRGTSWFWVYPALPALFVFVVLGMANWPTYRRLAREGVATTAHVATAGCDEGRFGFTFRTGAREWAGRARARRLGLNCGELVPGTPVPVVYLPSNPSRNAATSDAAALARREALIVVGFTVACYIACLGITWYDATKRGAPG